MTDYTELKRLAEAAPEGPWTYWGESANEIFQAAGHRVLIIAHDQSVPACKFIAAANPAAVLALIAESERLRVDLKSVVRLNNENADLFKAKNDRLRAEVAGLRTGYEAYEQVNGELKAEVELLESSRAKLAGELSRLRAKHKDWSVIAALGQGERS